MLVGQYIVQRLAQLGVKHVFGLPGDYNMQFLDMIEDENFTEFSDLIEYARENDYKLLELIVSKTFFFSKYLDSRRFRPKQLKEVSSDSEETNSHSMDNYTNHEDTDKVENDE